MRQCVRVSPALSEPKASWGSIARLYLKTKKQRLLHVSFCFPSSQLHCQRAGKSFESYFLLEFSRYSISGFCTGTFRVGGGIHVPVGVFTCTWEAGIRVRCSLSLSALLLETGSPTEIGTLQLASLAGQWALRIHLPVSSSTEWSYGCIPHSGFVCG